MFNIPSTKGLSENDGAPDVLARDASSENLALNAKLLDGEE